MDHEKRLYGTATVGTKGQVVIPAEAREQLDIQTGDRLYVIGSPRSKVVALIKEEQVEQFIEKMSAHLEDFRSLKNNTERK